MTHEEIRMKVTHFFEVNPDEELSVSDAAIKFGCEGNKARDILRAFEKQELLKVRWESVPNESAPIKIYSVK